LLRRIGIQIFKIFISGFLIVLLLRRYSFERILTEIRSANILWLSFAFILFIASHFLGSFQWQILLKKEGIHLSWKQTLSFYFIGLFFNNFLPSSLGGDFFRMADTARVSKNGTGAVSTVFLDRFMGLLVLSGLAVITLPVMVFTGHLPSSFYLPLCIFIFGWFIVILFLFNKKFAKPFAELFKRISPPRLGVKAREVYRKVYQFGRSKKLFLYIVSLSVVIQSARIVTHFLLSRSVGIQISPLPFFLIIPIIAVVSSVPISVGGVGVREQAAVILFPSVGLAAISAASFEFLAYLVAVISSIPGGLVFILRKRVDSKKSVMKI
jgi:uncharacterized protein (TIRG00374 family)